MDMQPIEPGRQLSATLTAEQWNVVMGHLDAGQHRVVRPIIDSLAQQLQQQSMSTADMARTIQDAPAEDACPA